MTDRDGTPGDPDPSTAEPTGSMSGPNDGVTEADGLASDRAAGSRDFAGPEADTDETVLTESPRSATAGAAAAGAGRVAGAGGAAAPGGATRSMRPGERRAARAKPVAAAPTPSERIVHVGDSASKLFVLATIAVFTLILLNALLLGRGGFLAPDPTPTPLASPSPSAAGSPAASARPSASASPGASPSAPSGSASGVPASGSPASSPSPAAGPS